MEALATKESVKVVTNVKQLHEESGDAPAGPPQLQTALSGGSKIEPKPRVVPPAAVTSPKAAAAAAAAAQQEQQSVNQWGSRFPAPKGLEADGVGSGNGGNNAAVGWFCCRRRHPPPREKPIPRPNNNSNAAPGAGGIKDGNAAQQAFPPGPRPLSSDANQQQSAVEAANAVFTAHEVFDNSESESARSLNEMSTSIRRSGMQSGSGSGSAQSINNASTVNSTLAQQQQQQQQQRQQQQQQQQRGGGGGGGGGARRGQ